MRETVERETLASHSNARLVKPRDPEAWTNPTYQEDKKIKQDRSSNSSQHGVNYVIQSYMRSKYGLGANARLTVGRQRI